MASPPQLHTLPPFRPVSHTDYFRYLLSLLTHLPPALTQLLFPCREESLKEQRHLLSSLPLLRCSSICSNHINIPQRCSRQGDPTPTGWLLISPDLPATAHTAAHSGLLLWEQSRMAFPLLPCTFCLAYLPHLSFLQCSKASSLIFTHVSKSAHHL